MLRWILLSISLVAVGSGLPQESRMSCLLDLIFIYFPFGDVFVLEHIFLYLLVTKKCKTRKILHSMIARKNLLLLAVVAKQLCEWSVNANF